MKVSSVIRRISVKAVALAMIGGLWLLADLPDIDPDERSALADRFAFSAAEILPVDIGRPFRSAREVHPALERIAGWISSVGAGVALADADGDKLPNDLCLVDPRNDTVTVAPVPFSGDRYRPFALEVPREKASPSIAPMGCLAGDPDSNGLTDFLVYYWGRPPILFLRRPGEAALSATAFEALEPFGSDEKWYTNAAAYADIDGDSHPDLIFGNYFADGSAILDTTGGGHVDMQHSMSRAFNGGRNRLFLWTEPAHERVAFRDVSDLLPAEAEHGWTLALGAADLDGDLRPEIYFANDMGPDRLLHNRSRPGAVGFVLVEGSRDFTTPRSKVLGQDSFKGMGVEFADLSGDGHLDIYVSNIAEEYALQESHFLFVHSGRQEQFWQGVAPFRDESEALGLSRSAWSWDVKLADFDNDGILEGLQATGFLKGEVDRWPELHELAFSNDELVRHPNLWPRFAENDDLSGDHANAFFVRDSDGVYRDIAADIGMAEATISRGIAVADVDGDGDLDIAVANQWEPSVFYRNDSPGRMRSIILDLRFPGLALGTSRPAIGASARLETTTGRVLTAQVDGGNGHSGKRAPELHFGLGSQDDDTPLAITVSWRDGNGVHHREYRLGPGRHRLVLKPLTGIANRAPRSSETGG